MLLEVGTQLLLRKFDLINLLPKNFREIEWFHQDNCRVTGPMLGVYELKTPLLLLDLGNKHARRLILQSTDLSETDLNLSVQYPNNETRIRVHTAIMESPRLVTFQGTRFADSPEVINGMEEIAIFTDRALDTLVIVQTQIN